MHEAADTRRHGKTEQIARAIDVYPAKVLFGGLGLVLRRRKMNHDVLARERCREDLTILERCDDDVDAGRRQALAARPLGIVVERRQGLHLMTRSRCDLRELAADEA
jgi:hypothetical protein